MNTWTAVLGAFPVTCSALMNGCQKKLGSKILTTGFQVCMRQSMTDSYRQARNQVAAGQLPPPNFSKTFGKGQNYFSC